MKSDKKSEDTLSRKREGLSKAARDLLARVRASPSPEVVFGLEPAAAEAKAHSVIDPLVEDTGLPVARSNQYRWYLAELCRLMRTRSGPDLAYCMEFTIKKWLAFGLEPNSVVVLASELYDRLKPRTGPNDEARMTNEARSPNDETGAELTTKTQRREEVAKTGDSPSERPGRGTVPIFRGQSPFSAHSNFGT